MAENLPTSITVALNSCFFFPHSTMQSHPASILSTGRFNFFTGTKEKLLSSVKSTTQVCRLDCRKVKMSVVDTWLYSSCGAWLSTLCIYFRGQEHMSVYIQEIQEASVIHSKGLLYTQPCACPPYTACSTKWLHTFHTPAVKLSASQHLPALGLHAWFQDIKAALFVSMLL